MYELILVSQSPRRRQLLENAGFLFRVDTVKISEIIEENVNLATAISTVAKTKAQAYLNEHKHLKSQRIILLSADTMVCHEGRALGKPENKTEAQSFLRDLSGRKHEVITGIYLSNLFTGDDFMGHVTTKVQFKKLADDEIQSYVEGGEPMDKAGAYAIQGEGKKFVEKIEGSYSNVVGLPVEYFEKYWQKKVGMLLAERIQKIKNQISNAEKSAGRAHGEVQLIAVSKNFSTDLIREAQALGLKSFGENYVQEAVPKLDELQKLNLDWHFIGHLQTNKAKNIVDRFVLIQTVDSAKIATEISKRSSKKQKILIEVDLAGEESKTGCATSELPTLLENIQSLPNIELCGLMFMAPLELTLSEQQKYFDEARKVRDSHLSYLSQPHSLVELSMGTSHDFEMAIKEGATMVRIGTAIFGERNYEQ